MSDSDISAVVDKLAQTKVNVQHELSFAGKGLKLNTGDDAKEIAEGIEKCPHMTALRLEGNTMGAEAAKVIGKALEKHPEFERALWSDMFTGRLKTEIPPALKSLGAAIITAQAHLVELNLSDNAFGPTGVEGIVQLLTSTSCYSLRELRLNNNGLGIGGGKMLAKSLLECHESSSAAGKPLSLRVFISGRNRLENEGATALAQAFKAIGTLEELAMPQNGINFPGITALSEAVAANPGLRVLNLNDNTFTEKGAAAMAKALPKLEKLEVLNFGDCLVRTEGAKSLAKALEEKHLKLKELILSGNEIRRSGALAVAESMENKDDLVKLDLDANMLGDEGVEIVQGTMEAMGRVDALGSFSDDEGEDDDEEGGQSDHNSESEEGEDDTEGNEVNDPHLQVKGESITPSKQTGNAKDFLQFPSPSKLLQLGAGRADAILAELGNQAHDVDTAVSTLIRISLVVSPGNKKATDAACDCADKLLSEVMKSDPEKQGVQVSNAILVYLGLIKGEDKKYKAPSDITGPLLVLTHVVQQPYFTKSARDILLAFICKPHPNLEKASHGRHQLLQMLYSF
ncbi:ran GTPase-activating protein 1-like [Liolophura sinensis]|uniref:ran GTPase-activating protein 1-like n=1 Tax=Liolophura sinensis TaxID=3198878 RepID=UPI0031595B84